MAGAQYERMADPWKGVSQEGHSKGTLYMTGGVPPLLADFRVFRGSISFSGSADKSESPLAVHLASPFPCALAIRPDLRIVVFRSGILGPSFLLRPILLSEIFLSSPGHPRPPLAD